ncbi:ThiF family adenylyltransferase [Bacillus stercoris]|nr:ThiF family adenylyltransferase [Bacillus stercoris]
MDFQLALQPTYTLDTQYRVAKHWIVVGAGGNGGYFIPQLVRQISLQNKMRRIENLLTHSVTIIDADGVEDKNLTRQNFLSRDVGYNKAEVMAKRYGAAFGVEINYIPEYLTDENMLESIIKQGTPHSIPVIVGAVDNNKTRAIIHNVFKSRKNTFWLDAGNEEWAGQVVCGFNSGKGTPQNGNKTPHLFDLPAVTDIYPEVLEATDKLPHELSCAERSVSNPQNIFTNQTASTLLLGFANTILTANARNGEGLKSHAVAFDAQTPSFTTTLNKMQFLKKKNL